MASLLEQLQPASYKGVPFLMTLSSITGGSKTVRHSFPNSNRQTIENLGLAPRIFEITAVITGEAYIQNRDRFASILEQGGPGVFVHPFYGQLNNYVARTYTLLEDLTALGEARFQIVFEISDSVGPPEPTANTLSVIDAANQSFVTATEADITENYNVSTSFTGNFTAAVDKMNDVVDEFRNDTSLLQASADQINAFNFQLSSLSNNITRLVQNPNALAQSITNLFSTVDGLYANASSTTAVLAQFFDFGDNDIEIIATTAGLQERKKNNDIINHTMQVVALSYAYFNTAQIDFETVDQIDTAADGLETQYQKVIESEGLADQTMSLVTDLRNEMQSFFNAQRIIARQVIEIETNKTSARLLAYKYYADSSQGETIIELNNIKQNVTFIQGNIKVLTA